MPIVWSPALLSPNPPPAAIGADPRLQAPASARSATSPEAASPARAVPITARPLWCPADSEIRVFTCIGISTPGVWLLCHFYRPPLECRGTQNNLGRRSILGAEVPDGPGFAHSSNQCHIMDGVDCLHPFFLLTTGMPKRCSYIYKLAPPPASLGLQAGLLLPIPGARGGRANAPKVPGITATGPPLLAGCV